MLRRGLLVAAVLLAPLGARRQDRPVRWQRTSDATEIPITVFHSPQSANLPTAETMLQGEWQFEISHRFVPAISDGVDALWGLDGPVNNRLGLAYALHDRGMLTIQRANLDDNVDLNIKVRVFEAGRGSTPVMLAVVAGTGLESRRPSAPGRVDSCLAVLRAVDCQREARWAIRAWRGPRFLAEPAPGCKPG